ncbi:MAG: HD domain-containing protein [Dehalococcoidales bacterium]|nr:HD domain-containing protein [Dehalococcoidales bacterium]
MFSFTSGVKNSKEVKEPEVTAEEYRERLELLYDVAQQASSFAEVSKLLQEVLVVIEQLLHGSASTLLLIDHEQRELYAQAAGGSAANTLKQMRLNLDAGITGWVARHAEPVIVNDVSQDKRFNKEVDNLSGFVTKSIIAAPLMRGREVIGVIEALNKADGTDFTKKDLGILTGFASTEALILLVSMAGTAINNIKLHEEMLDGYRSTVEALVTAADSKDPYACGHSRRVCEYVMMAAKTMDLTPEEHRVIEFGALLHDIGKIGIDDAILRRPRPLTDEEWYIIRKHPLRGANIVAEIPFLEKTKDIVMSHHERYDGTGYPKGLKGENIPLGARLVAVADAFDTMTRDHSYRPVLSTGDAINELIAGTGTQFCPVAVGAFIAEFKKQNQVLIGENDNIASESNVLKDAEAIESETTDAVQADEAKIIALVEAEEKIQETPQAEPVTVTAAVEITPLAPETPPEPAAEETTAQAEETATVAEEPAQDTPPAGPEKETFEGDIQIKFDSSASFAQIRHCKENLKQLANLKIILDSWSDEEGAVITVRAEKPVEMERLFAGLPAVQFVDRIGDRLLIVAASSAVASS